MTGGGGVRKFKDIIFGSCVRLLSLCIFLGYEFDAMTVSETVCAFY